MCKESKDRECAKQKKLKFWSHIQNILSDLNCQPKFTDKILDFGCGKGELVELLVRQGFRCTMGVDINTERIKYARQHTSYDEFQKFKVISKYPYHLPIENSSVDLILSCQVLEHVQNIDECFSEFSRIMHPNSISIHIFPPKYRFLETHTNIPFGNLIKKFWWHYLWISLGFRQKSMKGKPMSECANKHLEYIQKNTFYRTEEEIIRAAMDKGLKACFLNGLQYSYFFNFLNKKYMFFPARIVYSTFVSKVLFLKPSLNESKIFKAKDNTSISYL